MRRTAVRRREACNVGGHFTACAAFQGSIKRGLQVPTGANDNFDSSLYPTTALFRSLVFSASLFRQRLRQNEQVHAELNLSDYKIKSASLRNDLHFYSSVLWLSQGACATASSGRFWFSKQGNWIHHGPNRNDPAHRPRAPCRYVCGVTWQSIARVARRLRLPNVNELAPVCSWTLPYTRSLCELSIADAVPTCSTQLAQLARHSSHVSGVIAWHPWEFLQSNIRKVQAERPEMRATALPISWRLCIMGDCVLTMLTQLHAAAIMWPSGGLPK